MDIALGVSVTPTTVYMVLVEGAKADGVTIEADAFETSAVDGAVAPSASEQVSAAILATQHSARSNGHELIACGVVIGHDADAEEYRYSLAARGIEDVTLVSELQAAGALAHAVGRAIGYSATGFMVINPHTATLSIVEGADRSIRDVATRTLDGADPLGDLADVLKCFAADEADPQGLFILGSGMDPVAVKSHLEATSTRPVIVFDEPAWALARGAALVAATASRFDASTAGLAYTQDPDEAELVAGTSLPTGPLALADAVTRLAAWVDNIRFDPAERGAQVDDAPVRPRPVLPVASLVAAILVLAMVTLVMAFASTVEPAVDRGASIDAKMVLPSPPNVIQPPPPPVASQVAPAPKPSVAPVAPTAPAQRTTSPEQATVPVAVPAPRTVAAQAPAPQAQPQRSPPEEVNLPAAAPVAAAPAMVEPPPAAALRPPLAATVPSAPVVPTPSAVLPQITIYPIQAPPLQQASDSPSLWSPPSIWIQPPQIQQPQILQAQEDPPWLQIPLWPVQQSAPVPAPPQAVRPSIPLLPRTPQWPQNDNRQWPQSPVLSPPRQSTWVPDLQWPTSSDGSASPRIVEPAPVGPGGDGGSTAGSAPVFLWPRV